MRSRSKASPAPASDSIGGRRDDRDFLFGGTDPGREHKRARTADWARPDATETCCVCLFWSGEKRDRWGALKPAICRKARQLLLGRRLPPVPHHAHSCRFFEPNPTPPEAMK